MSRAATRDLGEICRFIGGVAFPERYQGLSAGDLPFYKVSDTNTTDNGEILSASANWVTRDVARELGSTPVPPGATVFPKVGGALLTNKRRLTARECAIDNNLLAAVPLHDHPRFLFELLRTIDFARIVQPGAVPSVTQGQLARLSVAYPPKSNRDEVARLSELQSRQERAIDVLTAAKKTLKRGLLQEVVSGRRRLLPFKNTPEWRAVPLAQVLRIVADPVEWDESATYRLVSIRRRNGGLFLREVKKGAQIKTKSLFTIREGDFLVSRMQAVHGALSVVPPEFDGHHVSGMYLVLRAKQPLQVRTEFLHYSSHLRRMYRNVFVSCHGVHIEKMTFDPKKFLKTTVLLPPLKEQDAIISLLKRSERELAALGSLRDVQRAYVDAAMRQLLDGSLLTGQGPANLEAPHA